MAHPKGGYRIDGERVPGVTTITGRFKESGALIRWAYNRGKEGLDLYASRDQAAESGTLAHAMIESYIHNKDWREHEDVTGQETDEVIAQAQKGFDNGRRWIDQSKIDIILTEPQLLSKEHRFGGSPDAIGKDIEERFCLLDWKTSRSFYAEFIVQVGGGYIILCDECLPEYPITGGIHLCKFSKEHAVFTHKYISDDELAIARSAFLKMRELYDEMKVLTEMAK